MTDSPKFKNVGRGPPQANPPGQTATIAAYANEGNRAVQTFLTPSKNSFERGPRGGPVFTQTTISQLAQRVTRSFFVCARRAQLGTLGVVVLLAMGCGGGGSSGGSAAGTPAVIATTPVDLPPGDTTAMLEWEPSAGSVSGYYVFESRNGATFSISVLTTTPQVEITGVAGDSVRIQVTALSEAGTFSVASPASVPFIFHAAETTTSAATAVLDASPPAPISAASAPSVPEPSDLSEAQDTAELQDDDLTGPSNAQPDEPNEEVTAEIDREMLRSLLGTNLRTPAEGFSQAVSQWLQEQVDARVGAGLSFVGTGKLDQDLFRELIWTDQSGQLFVSNGANLAQAETTDATAGLDEAIRLGATERFVGLADFDGDQVGDWLIEDLATSQLWLVDGATQVTIAVQAPASSSSAGAEHAQWLGHGDFDGDGLDELLWTHSELGDGGESAFQLSRPTISLGPISWSETSNWIAASHLLTVADLNGDGQDDLILVDADGNTRSALSAMDVTAGVFVPSTSIGSSVDGLELIATLDLEGDGDSDLAWLDGEHIAVWDGTRAP